MNMNRNSVSTAETSLDPTLTIYDQQRSNVATQDFEQFWRPIYETAPSENLESRWIKEIRSILQSHAPAQATESVMITTELYYYNKKMVRTQE